MKKIIRSIFAGALSVLALASCSSEGSGNYTSFTYTNCYNYVSDTRSGNGKIYGSPNETSPLRYSVNFDLDNMTANVGINGLDLGDGKGALYFELHDMKLSYSGGKYTVSATDVIPKNGTGALVDGYVINNFKMKYFGFMIMPENSSYVTSDVCAIEFTVNSTYHVTVIPQTQLFFGNTVVTTLSTGGTYKSINPYYLVKMERDSKTGMVTPTVTINNAQFAENMPKTNMTFKGAEVKFNDGGYCLSATSIIPESGDKPYAQYKVTDFAAVVNVESGAVFGFKVGDPATWSVSATLRYTESSSN